MAIVVQKYGGTSLADEDKIAAVARRVAEACRQGYQVVVVVSAMGKTTDELLALARRVHEDPPRREIDMLVSVGERISMALLSMAMHRLGHDAISFTGSQCGIITNDRHCDARIVEVRPFRIQDELARGRVVIVAGYQGMSLKREITTLGRGGSDTTAVALAAALGAEYCEILGDIDGVYSADPRLVPQARRLPGLGYQEMQELAESGARVLNATAVEFAKEQGIALYVRSSDGRGGETIIRRHAPRLPGAVVGVAHQQQVYLLGTAGDDAGLDAELLGFLDERGIAGKQLNMNRSGPGRGLNLVISADAGAACRRELAERFAGRVELSPELGAVSLIGAGINESFHNLRRCLAVLERLEAVPVGVHTSSFRISLLLEAGQVERATRELHRAFIEENDACLVPDDP